MGRTSRRPWAGILILAGVALAFLAALLPASLYAAPLVEPSSDLEAGLGPVGDVHRVAGDPATALVESAHPPAALVLLHPAAMSPSQQAILRGFVEKGGALWVLTARPLKEVLGEDAPAIQTWPGSLYQEKGARALVHAPSKTAFALPDARALQALPPDARVLVTSDPTSFRDSNGNGVLDLGEPSGPFDVAAQVPLGVGHVVFVAAPAGLPPAALVEALAGDAEVSGVWVAGIADAPVAAPIAHAMLSVALQPETSLVAAILVVVVAAALLVLLLKEDVAASRPKEERQPGLDAFLAALRASKDADDSQWLRQISQGGAS